MFSTALTMLSRLHPLEDHTDLPGRVPASVYVDQASHVEHPSASGRFLPRQERKGGLARPRLSMMQVRALLRNPALIQPRTILLCLLYL